MRGKIIMVIKLGILWQGYHQEHGCKASDPMILSSRKSKWDDLNSKAKLGSPTSRRRNPNDSSIDYGGMHPFEIMEKKRRARKLKGSIMYWYDPTFTVDDYIAGYSYDVDDTYDPEKDPFRETIPKPDTDAKMNWEGFQPIRIRFDATHLDETNQDSAKNELITYHVLPAAIQFWTKALMVYPAKRIFINTETCSLAKSSDYAYGLNNADLVIYISANRYCNSEVSDLSIAGADSCDWDDYDRPIAGVIDFCYQSFNIGGGASQLEETKMMLIEVAIHEMGHVLGLRSKDLAFYYDRLTGLPRTPGYKVPDPNIECINGKKASEMNKEVYRPALTTLQFGAIYPGIKYFEVVTPTVQKVARNHFNCPTMKGMRLENQPTSDDCFGDHWEERLAWDSSMSAILTPGSVPEYLSPFTLALLEDSGWYKANFTMASNPSFGHGAGCDFVEQRCIVDGEPAFPEFCNTVDKGVVECDPTHQMMALCDLYDLSTETGQAYPPVPQIFRYFDNPAWGPKKMREADWCPMFSMQFESCAKSFSNAFEEESFGPDSRCFKSNYRPLCFDMSCSEELNVILVQVGGDEVQCDYDGQKINITFAEEGSYFECPKFRTVCPNLVCPSGCGGKGSCDWNAEIPTCIFSQTLPIDNGEENNPDIETDLGVDEDEESLSDDDDIMNNFAVEEDDGGMYISEAYISVISMYITVFVHLFTILGII